MKEKEKILILIYLLMILIGITIAFVILFNKLTKIHDDTQQTLIDHRTMTCKIADVSINSEVIIKCYPEYTFEEKEKIY